MGTETSKQVDGSEQDEGASRGINRASEASAIAAYRRRASLLNRRNRSSAESSPPTSPSTSDENSHQPSERNNRVTKHVWEVVALLNNTANEMLAIICKKNNPGNEAIYCRRSLLANYSVAYQSHVNSLAQHENDLQLDVECSPEWMAIFVLWLYTGCIHDFSYFDPNEPNQSAIPPFMRLLKYDAGVVDSLLPWLDLENRRLVTEEQKKRAEDWNIVGPWASWTIGDCFTARGFQDEIMEHIFSHRDIHPINPVIAREVYDNAPKNSKLRQYFADVLALKWDELYLAEKDDLVSRWDRQWYFLCETRNEIVMDQDRIDIQRSRKAWPEQIEPWSYLRNAKYLFRLEGEPFIEDLGVVRKQNRNGKGQEDMCEK